MDVHVIYQGRAAFGSILLHHRAESASEAEFEQMVEALVLERRRELLKFLTSCLEGEGSQ